MRKIFQTRNLTFLWLGQTISQSGDSIYQIGLLWLALELSASKAVVGLVAMSAYLPAMLISIFAGVVADRVNRRRIMLIADAFRAIVILGLPIAWKLGILSTPMLALNAFIIAGAAAFFNPARDAVIPQLVPCDGLMRANSLIQTSWQFSMLLGPLLAALLLQHFGIIHLFTVDSGAYFLSFIFILLMRPRAENKILAKTSSMEDLKSGLRYVRNEKVIFPLLLITIADNFFIMGPAYVGTPVFVKETLSGTAGNYALITGSYAVGMLIGTAGLLWLGNRIGKGRVLLIGMMLDGITFVPYFFADSITDLALYSVIHSLAIPMLTISRASIIQEIVPHKMRGRVFALVNLAVVGLTAVSSGLSGLILEFIDAPTLFLIGGILGCLCGVIGWLFARSLWNHE